MEFGHDEKMAIIKMTYAVIYADGVVHRDEIAALHSLKFQIGFDTDFISTAQNMDEDKALVILHNMTYTKKQALGKILDNIALADNHLHDNEVDLIIDTFKNLGIGEETE